MNYENRKKNRFSGLMFIGKKPKKERCKIIIDEKTIKTLFDKKQIIDLING